jgi:hypothetical protein
MAKGKARGFEALMGWLSGRGVDPDQAEALLRSIPNVENMTPADLSRLIDAMNSPAPRARMESPVSVEDRVAGSAQTGMRPDPNIRAALQELDPEFAARIDTASPEEIMQAYRNAVNKADKVRRGRPKMVMDTPVADVAPPPRPTRQMELPLGPSAQEPDIRSLIPLGRPGPGVPGQLSGPGQILTRQLDMIPAPLRGLPAPTQRRLGTTAGVPMGPSSMPAIDVPFEVVQPTRRLTDARQTDDFTQRLADGRTQAWSGGSADEYVDWLTGQPVRRPRAGLPQTADELADGPSPGMRPRPVDAPKAPDDGPKVPWKSLAGGLGAGLGVSQLMPENAFDGKGSSTADLAAESRPAPKVEATPAVPQPAVKQGPPDYAAQARELIARANDIQRQAGRQTPESIALINQANKLYEMAAEGRRNGSQPAIMPVEQQNQQTSSIQRNSQQQIAQNQGSDYRSQARRMMAELNIRSSQGNISSAEYSAVKRRIDELFALADAEGRNKPAPRGQGMGRTQLIGKPKRGPSVIGPTRGYKKRTSPSTT